MRYYHDPARQAVYAVPDEPHVVELKEPRRSKDPKRQRHAGWQVSVQIEVTRADNYLLRPTHQWYPTTHGSIEKYGPNTSEKDAVGYFKAQHMRPADHWQQVTADEYRDLKSRYDATAHANMASEGKRSE